MNDWSSISEAAILILNFLLFKRSNTTEGVQELSKISPNKVLVHPTWNMGNKIKITTNDNNHCANTYLIAGPICFVSYVSSSFNQDDAKFIVEQLILSLPSFIGDQEFNEIVNNIKSPNGTTEAGINSLNDNSFDKIIYDAIEAAVKRSIKISKEINDGWY